MAERLRAVAEVALGVSEVPVVRSNAIAARRNLISRDNP